jgi:copper chaperone CopZ
MNKKTITIVAGFFLSLFFLTAAAQQEEKKMDTVKIMTSAQCGMCKDRIETALNKTKGIKHAELDLKTKIVTVQYKPWKTSPDEIREAITEIGYDADKQKADPKAYEQLPGCCKKPWDR